MLKHFRAILFLLLIQAFSWLNGQDPPEVIVDINLDVLHEVRGESMLDRQKFITIHASHTAKDLIDEPRMFQYMMDELDISFGRDMGRINWDLNQVAEDQARPGYPNYFNMVAKGQQSREWYAKLTGVHHLEGRSSLVVCPPVHPFWPAYSPTNPHSCCGGTSYTLKDVSATAELFGNWLNLYHGKDGMPLPSYFEVINEPLWEMVDNNQIATTGEVFEYHKQLADGIRAINDQVKIGGYTTAIPAFERDDFQRWNERWKLFIDSVGSSMDFFSLHFYDVYNNGGQKHFRKGSNMEASLDMIEHYSHLVLDTIKPFVISEFCAQTNHMRNTYWTPYRDWLQMKSITPMWLSFMERPHQLAKTVPFVVLKATWYNSEYPYQHRLMRQAKEKEGEEGDHWVFTEFIKVYQLWAGVKGRRIDSWATDPDIQVDAYVEGNEAHVIINNLEFKSKTIGLNLMGIGDMKLEQVIMKHLHLQGDAPVLDTSYFSEAPAMVTIAAEASMVLRYTFRETDSLDTPQSSREEKYYANSYLRPILAGSSELFQINEVDLGLQGEGILRMGLGRDHGQALHPVVKFNDSLLHVPEDFRGDSQTARGRFFGVIEIPVPYFLLKENNNITVEFTEEGGHISSLSLQVFNSTRELLRSKRPTRFKASFQVSSSSDYNSIEGAMVVFADDTTYTNDAGLAVLDTIEEGYHFLEISAENYESYTVEEFPHFENKQLKISLEPYSYRLSFLLSEKELNIPVYNAMIETGGHTAYSNIEGEADFTLYNGKHLFHITDPYFEDLHDSLVLESDSTLYIDFKRLKADVKFVILNSPGDSRVRDAIVELGDTSILSNTLGLATFKSQKINTLYKYQVTKEGMLADLGELLLKGDSTLNIHLVASGTGPPEALQRIEIYPTPAEQYLVIHMGLPTNRTLMITAVDQTGRERKVFQVEGNAGDNQINLDISDLDSGFYLLIMQHGDQTSRRKIIIQ